MPDPLPPPVPTQAAHPWRAVLRTVVQLAVGLAAVTPALVDASGVDQTLPWVGVALGVAAVVTRVMSTELAEALLRRWLPGLAAQPRPRRPDTGWDLTEEGK